jgi:hypothetical protein
LTEEEAIEALLEASSSDIPGSKFAERKGKPDSGGMERRRAMRMEETQQQQ